MSLFMPTSDGESGHKNSRARYFLLLIVLLAAVLIFMQIYLPRVTAKHIAQNLQDEWGMDFEPTVKVKVLPFSKIWRGYFDELVIRGHQTVAAGILIEQWEIHLYDVQIKESEMGQQEFDFQEGKGYADITEKAIEDYLVAVSPVILDQRISITDDHIFYSGSWKSGIVKISFSVTGMPYISEESKIRMAMDRITIGPFEVPGMIRDITESFELDLLPVEGETMFAGFAVSDVALSEGVIRISLLK
jgi:hypothetical protein